MLANNSTPASNDTRCGGLNPSFHHCYSSEIHSFEEALKSILVVEFLIVFFGVLGNTCLFFLMRRDRFSPQAFAVYFMFSAVSDSINLVINLASDAAGSIRDEDFSAQAARNDNCGWLSMVDSVPGLTSPWLIVLLTLDRFLATWFPHRHSKMVNRRRGFFFASGLVLIAVGINIPFATSYKTHTDVDDLNQTRYSCELTLFSDHEFAELVSIIISNIIPLGLILVLSAAIFCGLSKTKRFRSPRCCQWNRTSVLVFYIAIMIFLAWFPGNVVTFVETSYAAQGVDSPLASFVTDKTWHACLMLYLFSFSQNFYILMIISPMYRQEFKKMIRLKKDIDNKEDEFELDSDDDSTPMLNEAEPKSTQTDSITL